MCNNNNFYNLDINLSFYLLIKIQAFYTRFMADSLSPQKIRAITHSLTKINKSSSEGRFRIKSLRAKTIQAEQQKCATDIDYQLELNKKLFSKEFLKSLYILKSQQAQFKVSESKYRVFLKFLDQRISNSNTLDLFSCNFQKDSAMLFLNQFIKINRSLISYDLSKCPFISGYDPKSTDEWILEKIIRNDQRVVKLVLKNIGFGPVDLKKILNLIVETSKIYSLDISNDNSQSMNRFVDEVQLLFDFFKYNTSTSIVNLANLNIRKIGVQNIQKGLSLNSANPLKILNIKNNCITEQASLHISMIVRTGLVFLDLSQNPLGPNFFMNLPSWKHNTVRNLNLSSTQMNSQSLIFFLSRLEQNKFLQHLKLDENDFSNNWFNQLKQALEINTFLQTLSLVNCKINRVSETFAGLYPNRYLRKINISSNQFNQGVKEICQAIKINKTLKQIKMRACGLKPEHLISIFEALDHNTKINTIDISQNNLGQEGAKKVLKTLAKNISLTWLISEKVQIPFQYKQQIEQKIQANRDIKKKRQILALKKQNKIVKQSDFHTWDDVQDLQAQVRLNNKRISALQSKVSGLQQDYDHKRHRFQQIMKECQGKEQKLSQDVEEFKKKLSQLELQEQNTIKKFNIKKQGIQKALSSEEQKIQNLEQMIRDQSIKNQKRQNQLQDQYENLKYLQKKKQVKKQIISQKSGFDTSTALLSKRKSRNI